MHRALAFAAASLIALPALADSDVRHAFDSSLPRAGARRVVVDIPAGEVIIRNGDSATIAVSGEVQRTFDGYRQREKQQAMVDDTTVVLIREGDAVRVARQFGPSAQSWTARSFHTAVRVHVAVPAGMDVEIGTRFGEVRIDGDFGDVDADLRAGEIRARLPRAPVRDLSASVRMGEVHVDSGDERVNNEGLFPRASRYHNEAGRTRVNLHTTAGEVHVQLR